MSDHPREFPPGWEMADAQDELKRLRSALTAERERTKDYDTAQCTRCYKEYLRLRASRGTYCQSCAFDYGTELASKLDEQRQRRDESERLVALAERIEHD